MGRGWRKWVELDKSGLRWLLMVGEAGQKRSGGKWVEVGESRWRYLVKSECRWRK